MHNNRKVMTTIHNKTFKLESQKRINQGLLKYKTLGLVHFAKLNL